MSDADLIRQYAKEAMHESSKTLALGRSSVDE
jgi:hypothetical protein